MATLIAYQDGDFTGATTFKALVGGTGSAQETITASTNTTTAYVSSSAFTVTNTHVIEGVMVHCRRLNTTGTVSVALSDDNGVTATREVTVDASDLPDQNSWVFFKFGTTLTGDGGADYKVMVKGSSANNAVFFRDATAGNWARLLRRDSTATIATTDVVYISGERTGAGSVTSVTVTMDQTATTSYGAMNIGDAGTVSYGTSASTNYYLRLAGNLNVFGNGTLNIGTSGTRIPSTSTATLEFNCSTNGQFGLFVLAGGIANIYGAEKANTKVLLTADANSGQAVITVEDTTGWAVSDEVAIAPTTRTINQAERRTVSTITSSTQATLNSNLSFAHQGTAPYQGEVINLTRNVKIRGTSASLNSPIQLSGTLTCSYAEFFFIGSSGGVGIDCRSSGAVFSNCSLHTFSGRCFYQPGAASWDVQDCVFGFNGNAVFEGSNAGNAGATQKTIRNNWAINGGSQTFLRTASLAGTIEGNKCAGFATGYNFDYVNSVLGTFSNNLAHTCTNGLTVANLNFVGTINNFTAWRCATNGISNTGTGLSFVGASLYHNVTNANLLTPTVFTDSVFDGGTGQSLSVTTTQIIDNGTQTSFENCDFGQTNQATNFINANRTSQYNVTFTNCDIAESLTPLNQSNIFQLVPTSISAIKFDKLNSTSGNHRAYKRFGYAGSDQSVFRTASPSEVLVPNSASGKLPSGSKKFGVASGNDATVSVWVRKSSTYNGAEPRLILKRNIVGGVTSDQVLATLSGGTEEWLELTASTPTVTDDCVLEVYVDCSATAGTVNIDDWSIS